MTRLAIVLAVGLALTATVALAASKLAAPPSGPAPRTLLGTYRTTLTRADVAKAAVPDHVPTFKWELAVVNSGYLKYPRALGLRPFGQGGDTAFRRPRQPDLHAVSCQRSTGNRIRDVLVLDPGQDPAPAPRPRAVQGARPPEPHRDSDEQTLAEGG
jgi:hypothetical protein